MCKRFDCALCNQRWHAKSGSNQHKRRIGSALTTRCDDAQARELVHRVLTNNLMLLAATA
jgi:hypothetical protein